MQLPTYNSFYIFYFPVATHANDVVGRIDPGDRLLVVVVSKPWLAAV